jgi:SAM-dependent methyltransferase
MYLDVTELRDFYDGPLGRIAARHIRRQVQAIWPDMLQMSVLGIGYATPYLDKFHETAERVLALMPARQGVIRWPRNGRNLAVLGDEMELPFLDASIDRILLIHALENAGEAHDLMREIWRVLASGGRLLAVVPNRTGMWAKREITPFGHGRPYSKSQLASLLSDTMFSPLQWSTALHVPPSTWRLMQRLLANLEPVGAKWWGNFGGVHIVEAEKRIYVATSVRAKRRLAARPALIPSS